MIANHFGEIEQEEGGRKRVNESVCVCVKERERAGGNEND